MKGIRVLKFFMPTKNGVEPVDYKTQSNTISSVPGKQAAATVGGGITYKEFDRVLARSGLYSTGAAHGTYSLY
jgi:hypothetical protein